MIYRLLCLSLVLLLPTTLRAYEFKPEAGFSAVLDIKGFSSKASVPTIQNTQLKSNRAQLNLPVNIYLTDNIFAELEPFAKTYYNDSAKERRETSVNFLKAAVFYKTDNFMLKAGRQTFEKYNKNLIIYYGNYGDATTADPTALDGVRNTFNYGVFYYDVLLAKEAPALAWDNPQSIVGGGELGIDIKDFFNFNVFVYRKTGIESRGFKNGDKLVYGAGAEIKGENADFAITGAISHNQTTKTFTMTEIHHKFRGHIISAIWNLKRETPLITAKYRLRTALINQDNSCDKRYTPISSNSDFGVIFNGNTGGGFNENLFASLGSAGTSIYSAGAEFTPQIFKNINLSVDLYNYQSVEDALSNKDLGYEVDAALNYNNTFCKLTLYYGYFSGGQGLKEKFAEVQKETIHKIGFYSRFMFDF